MSEIINQSNVFRQVQTTRPVADSYFRLQAKIKTLRLPYPVKLGMVATGSATLGFGIIFVAQTVMMGLLHAS
jgi:hypothetical protein